MTVKLKLHHAFGFSEKIRNNLLFLNEQTIIFPSGNNCVCFNVQQRWTRFIPGGNADQQGPQGILALALSPDRHYLAVSEKREQGTITIYDLQNKQCFKKQVLTGGNIDIQEFVCLAFSADSKYLLGQSGAPDWTLFYWDWEKNEVIALVKTTRVGFVSQVSFNPKHNTQICVSGKCVFKIFKLEKNSLNQSSSFEMGNITSHAWMSKDSIILGTETGNLLMLKAGRWRDLGRASERQTMRTDSSSTGALQSITAITQYCKGFACAAGPGLVCLYDKRGESYTQTAEIRIPQDACSNQSSQSEQKITAVCLSPSEKTLAISTRQGQIYHCRLDSPEIIKGEQADFKFLFHSVHSGSITGLSTCSSKPLFATCSKDNSVRIWNYKTNSLELIKEFPQEPKCISFHPNGLTILVGFADNVCLMSLLVGEFRTIQEFRINDCSECLFSHEGSMFAVVTSNFVNIFHSRTGEKVSLHGHINEVQSVKWSKDDHRLVSCAANGTICEWNSGTWTSKSTKVPKPSNYIEGMFLPNTENVLLVASGFNLIEFRDGEIHKEMASNGSTYTAISMTHCGQAIFCGGAAGNVRVIQYPLDDQESLTEYAAHSGPITRMAVTPDNQYLLTASVNGSLLIWIITDQKGRNLSVMKETDHPEESILDGNALVEFLKEERVQNEMACKEMWDNVRQNFHQEIEALKHQIQMMNNEMEKMKVSQEKTITEIMEKHAKELKDQENGHKDEMLNALKKHEELEDRLQAMQQNYEERLQKQEENHLRNMMDMKLTHNERLQGMMNNETEKMKVFKENTITEIVEKLKDQGNDHKDEMLKALKKHEELKQRMLAMQQNYEERLQKQEDIHLRTMTDLKLTYNDRLQEHQHNLQKAEEKQKELIEKHESELKEICLQYDDKLSAKKQSSTKLKKEIRILEEQQQEILQRSEEIQKELREKHGSDLNEIYLKYEKKLQADKETIMELEQENKTLEQQLTKKNDLVRGMKTNIMKCANFLYDPIALRDNFIKLRKMYICEEEMLRFRAKAGIVPKQTRQKDHLRRTEVAEKQRLSMKASILKQQDTLQKSVGTQTETRKNLECELKEICRRYRHKAERETSDDKTPSLDQQQTSEMWTIKEEKQEESIEYSLDMASKDNKTIQELTEKLNKEMEKVNDMKTLVQWMKFDIAQCSNFIHEPVPLRENFLKLRKTYIREAEMLKFKERAWLLQKQARQREQQKKKELSQKKGHSIHAKAHQGDCATILKIEDNTICIKKQLIEPIEERKSTEPEQLQNMIQEKKFEAEAEIKAIDLKQKLKIKEKELCTERQRVRQMRTQVERMKSDIQKCSSFIGEPKMLKENFMKLYKNYIHGADMLRFREKAGDMQEQTQQKEQLQRAEFSKWQRQAMEAKYQTESSNFLRVLLHVVFHCEDDQLSFLSPCSAVLGVSQCGHGDLLPYSHISSPHASLQPNARSRR